MIPNDTLSKESLTALMKEAHLSLLSLADALSSTYSKGTFFNRFNDYVEDPDSFADDYLKGVFDFLFTRKSIGGSSVLVSPLELAIRFAIFDHYIAKTPANWLDDVLGRAEVDDLVTRARDLAKLIERPEEQTRLFLAPWEYEERIGRILKKAPNIRVITPKREDKHYLIFTTNTLHEAIRPGKEHRRLWQNVHDPFFFTLCFAPMYRKKGICCELWLYENPEPLRQWKACLEGVGFKVEGPLQKHCLRCSYELFVPDMEMLKGDLNDYLGKVVPAIESKILEAHKTMTSDKQ